MMALLETYEDFLNRVDELGFMAFSNFLPGFPTLSEETLESNWHTRIEATDPWRWKNRAAAEKRLAFGCILGGHKGFVAPRMYSLFYAAFHPGEPMEERRESGQISETAWRLWQLFQGRSLLNTSDIRQELGVTLKKGGSKVDRAITELQQYYYITVAGSGHKRDKYGQPYGWAVNVYDLVENWAPGEWLDGVQSLSPVDAREQILDNGVAIGKNIKPSQLAKVLGINM